MWKAEQEKRAKAGEDFQTDQKSRAAVEKVIVALFRRAFCLRPAS